MESNSKRLSTKKLIVLLIIFSFVAVCIEAAMALYVLKGDLKKSSDIFLNQMESIVSENELEEGVRFEELKETYIISAKAAAYMISDKPARSRSFTELTEVAKLLSVDELHIFDETGTIIGGTNPEYYGYNFDSGEQMAYFKPMLNDKSLSMCQDVTPNTAVGKNMMYAITWSEDGKIMVQVGVEPIRLLEMVERNDIDNVVNNIPLTEGYDLFVTDTDSNEIIATTCRNADETSLFEDIKEKVEDNPDQRESDLCHLGYSWYYFNNKRIGDYNVVIVYDLRYSNNNFLTSILILLAYMLIGGGALVGAIHGSHELEDRKNSAILEQYRILSSMADIYYSLYLVDLVNDTSEEYKSQGEVKQIMDRNSDAAEMMRKVMKQVTAVEYIDKALEFTELSTIAERLGDRKIITSEFVGKHIGWFEASFIVVEKDEDGKPVKVIYSTRSIDDIKKKEEKLIFESNTDELTGCYNRRAYDDAINELEENANNEEFILVSMDVDGLKKVNDTLGHKAGDELIVGASECMNRAFSQYGKVYRVGGDEFAALLSTDVNQLMSILRVFELSISRWSGRMVKELSVSYGYVSRKDNMDISVEKMTILADKKMYEAKSEHYREKGVDRREQ